MLGAAVCNHMKPGLRGRYCAQFPKSCVDTRTIGNVMRIPCSTAMLRATEGKAKDFICVLCYPQAIGIVLQRKRLKFSRAYHRHCPKAVTFGEFIDATND